jgi:adenosylhomocysteinase
MSGLEMIEFARARMPALGAAERTASESGSLAGARVGVALTLEPKTACLVEALRAAGAEVSVLGSSNSTKQPVADALADLGSNVFAEAGATPERVEELRNGFIDTRPELLADDGAGVTRRIHRERRDVLASLVGVAEETTSGVRPLRVMHAEGTLEVACIAVNDARSKVLFDNVYGTGQSVVMATLDAMEMDLANRSAVVMGYGRVGRGIASVARAMGGRVTVTEIDPVAALRAVHDGFDVARISGVIGDADVVFTATGIGHSLTAHDVDTMKDGSVVAVGGMGRPEFDPTIGPPLGRRWRDSNVVELITTSGAVVSLIADGYCANTSAGEGNPIEIMDLSLALQLRALLHLADSDLPVGVHLLPAGIDDEVARSQLFARGVRLDDPSDAQRRDASTW